MKNAFCKTLYIIFFVIFVWTFSISMPIYCRSFYFCQIDSLQIEHSSGLSEEQIVDSYNDMLDYLTLHKDFSLGGLPYTEEGKDHFQDCQRLFDLNLSLMILSFVGIAILIGLELGKKIDLRMRGNFHASFYAGIIAIALPLILVCFCAINFDAAFKFMHAVLFPGKQNWIFDTTLDPVINILPEQFFANCAILIVGVMAFLVLCAMLTSGLIRLRQKKSAK